MAPPAKNLEILSLTATASSVIYHTGEAIVCLDRLTGKQQWVTQNKNAESYRFFVNHTILARDVLLVEQPEGWRRFSVITGKQDWNGPGPRGGFAMFAPPDLYVIDDLVWVMHKREDPKGLNLRTGKVERRSRSPSTSIRPSTTTGATVIRQQRDFIMDNKRGIEMIGLDGESFSKHDWVQGMCRYGVLPANGLIYSLPHPCACYTGAQLNGFNALASTSRHSRTPLTELREGPAFGTTGPVAAKEDWPTFRGNPIRSGSTDVSVNDKPTQAWMTQLGGKLSQPIIAAGKNRRLGSPADALRARRSNRQVALAIYRRWPHRLAAHLSQRDTLFRHTQRPHSRAGRNRWPRGLADAASHPQKTRSSPSNAHETTSPISS